MVTGGVEVAGDDQRSVLPADLFVDMAELGHPPNTVIPEWGDHVDRVEP